MVVVLTKADALSSPARSYLIDEGLTVKKAKPKVADMAAQILSRLEMEIQGQLNGKKYPPKAYLSMASEWPEV